MIVRDGVDDDHFLQRLTRVSDQVGFGRALQDLGVEACALGCMVHDIILVVLPELRVENHPVSPFVPGTIVPISRNTVFVSSVADLRTEPHRAGFMFLHHVGVIDPGDIAEPHRLLEPVLG